MLGDTVGRMADSWIIRASVSARTTQPQQPRGRSVCWLLVPTSHNFSYYPPDLAHTMPEDVMLMEMPGTFEREQREPGRLDVVRFVI